mgnify:CR=1 FL=1|tara:strand:+ start:3255 stop:3890 length:636 start_codon:yes stop_codon:yes gene_type:complete
MFETPFLINVNISTFEDYIKSLATTGKKNYKYSKKQNEDLKYNLIPYNQELVNFFMSLWENQLIRGEKRKWGFPSNYIHYLANIGVIKLFAAYTEEDNTVLSIHFVEKYNDYVYCHPPLYDKETTNNRYMAKYMWFNLINYYIDNKEINWIDFGAGNRGTWKDLVKNRQQYMDKMAYKWLYVPKNVKENPDRELPYIVNKSNNQRKLMLKN